MRTHQGQLPEEKSAGEVAAESGDEWRRIKRALAPIIGQRGIAAVFNRALYLASLQRPILIAVLEDDLFSSNFDSLEAALSMESAEVAVAANQYFYLCFKELISSLVGESLALRLLGSIPMSGSGLGLLIHESHIQSAEHSGRENNYVRK